MHRRPPISCAVRGVLFVFSKIAENLFPVKLAASTPLRGRIRGGRPTPPSPSTDGRPPRSDTERVRRAVDCWPLNTQSEIAQRLGWRLDFPLCRSAETQLRMYGHIPLGAPLVVGILHRHLSNQLVHRPVWDHRRVSRALARLQKRGAIEPLTYDTTPLIAAARGPHERKWFSLWDGMEHYRRCTVSGRLARVWVPA